MIVVVDNTRGGQNTYYKLLIAYLKSRKWSYRTVRTVPEMREVMDKAQCFILSGSSTNIPDMDETHVAMNTMAIKSGVPVIGICFGAQFICTHFGGSIEKMSRTICGWRKLANSVKARFCARFRVLELPPRFLSITTSVLDDETTVVAFQHAKKPIVGLLFHPEFDPSTYHILDDLIAIYAHK